MSWYFFGGFSAYAMVPSASTVKNSGCSLAHGWSGAACSAKSRAISRPSSLAWSIMSRNSSSPPRFGSKASWPPCLEPIAHGEPTSPSSGVSVLFRPLRLTSPMGWIGGKYTVSKPMSATRFSCAAVVSHVPWTGLPIASTPPVERGNNSYQELTSASRRSTRMSATGPRVTSSRSGYSASTSRTSVETHGAMRSASGSVSSRSVARAFSNTCDAGVWAIAAANRSAPWAMSLASSFSVWPAASFFSTALRHVAITSLHASTR